MKILGYILWSVASLVVIVAAVGFVLGGWQQGYDYDYDYAAETDQENVSQVSPADLSDPAKQTVRSMQYVTLPDGGERVVSTIGPTIDAPVSRGSYLVVVDGSEQQTRYLNTACFVQAGSNIVVADMDGDNPMRMIPDPALLLDSELLIGSDTAMLAASFVPAGQQSGKISCKDGVMIAVYDLYTGAELFAEKADAGGFHIPMVLDGKMISFSYADGDRKMLAVLDTETGSLRKISSQMILDTEK